MLQQLCGRAFGLALFVLGTCWSQTPEPGVLPKTWATGGPNCVELPAWQIHQYNPSFLIIRQSGCTHYEKPFLYLLFGTSKALLVDTGAGKSDAGVLVGKIMRAHQGVELVVSHSHGHGDHTAGDTGFEWATLIPTTAQAEQKAFGITNWPESSGSIDLGDRVIDVLAIPGHELAHLAYYDRRTGILLTGDSLYPGRLYISDYPSFLESMRRLVRFTADKPVTHILGCHIEQSATPYVDYPVGTRYQPEEHELALSRAHLLELVDGLEKMNGKPVKAAFRDFTIFPKPPR